MVESAVIFRTLYSFTSFGVNPDGSPSSLDPPEHLFRIRLVCTILDTCGQYFDRGSSKRKLDCFLVYFQVYKLKYVFWHHLIHCLCSKSIQAEDGIRDPSTRLVGSEMCIRDSLWTKLLVIFIYTFSSPMFWFYIWNSYF